jgi:hypothetical protein
MPKPSAYIQGMQYAVGDTGELDTLLASRGWALFLRKLGQVAADDATKLMLENEPREIHRLQGRLGMAQEIGRVARMLRDECGTALKGEE